MNKKDKEKQGRFQRKLLFDQTKKDYEEANNCNVVRIWQCEWRKHVKTNQVLKNFLKSIFPFKVRQISKEKIIQRIVNK